MLIYTRPAIPALLLYSEGQTKLNDAGFAQGHKFRHDQSTQELENMIRAPHPCVETQKNRYLHLTSLSFLFQAGKKQPHSSNNRTLTRPGHVSLSQELLVCAAARRFQYPTP